MTAGAVQVLACNDANLRKRVAFLQRMGLSDSEAALVISRCPQVLMLSVENNIWPKFEYLTQHMGGSAQSIVTCPVFLTLSLNERCDKQYWGATLLSPSCYGHCMS